MGSDGDAPDTDADGVPDTHEQLSSLPTMYGPVETDYGDPDSDGDGLRDGAELGDVRNLTLYGVDTGLQYYALSSRPDTRHSDADTLGDGTEVDGWNVSVLLEAGTPYTWVGDEAAPSTLPKGTMRVDSSDPLRADTDGDGVDDDVERDRLHTHPRRAVTYQVTRERQRALRRGLTDSQARTIGLLPRGESIDDLELTDATDDFDFVRADDGDVAFTALDRQLRTDTWLSNVEEVTQPVRTDEAHDHEQLDVWDPDTDDDGLTDGQEVDGITSARIIELRPGLREELRISGITNRKLSPVDPDTDGDGWWDGWIGVYNATNNSRNVVLYMEHLRDDDDGDGWTVDSQPADDGGVRVHLYECRECGDQFESAKSADRAQCMECLSMDVEPVGEAERP